ncbi:methyl-accepting chemotaxis protein [Falsiroseomonas ponticola]|uniref:methyl-accepting chemotaxis protein n=1 Tax=Falsiroseomonas ponticola TaxID=2786951 RepID=UPI0019340009|nr:methyl-accepting chemotaxis protein [Roseomonas ponticola]
MTPYDVPAAPDPLLPARPGAAEALLAQWVELGEIERRAFIAMTEEVNASARLIEDSTVALSAKFRHLAEAAEAQTARVERVAAIARMIEVEGRPMPLAEATAFVEAMLGRAVTGLLDAAAQAARMMKALDEVKQEVRGVEACVTRIEAINRQAQFVAINATIEAHRAEGAGGTFKVIAHELKELAKETNATSRLVHERITAAGRGVSAAQADLARIAGGDNADIGKGQARLAAVMAGMVDQNRALSETLAEARDAAAGIDAIVDGLVTGAQFQDRTNQHLTHVMEAMGVIGDAAGALQAETTRAWPALVPTLRADGPLLRRMLDQQSLSSVRARFLHRLLDDGAPVPEEPDGAGDIELF